MGDGYRALDRDVESAYRILKAKNPRQEFVVVPVKEIIEGFYQGMPRLAKKEEPAEKESEPISDEPISDTERTKTLAETA
ncbi:hypothetical protein JXB28_01840 [Candidatus Woesearchaeota archaeon]|nr:hypothetical protein [Candidatus Woesearchaeota archaeon]